MRKTIILALAVMASASFCTIDAKKKKKEEVKQETVVAPVELKTSSDSVSYTAGMAVTNGLLPFLKQQHGIDSASIGLFLKSGEWINRYGKSYPIGYEFSMKERWMITVNAVIKDALELEGDNGVEKKGSYAMFCLRVFAKDLLANVKKNWVDKARFFVSDVPTMDDIVEDLDFENAEEDSVLFDETPVAEEAPEEDFEEPPMNADYIEFIMSQCPPDEDECDLVG
jgi:hypothetical protein